MMINTERVQAYSYPFDDPYVATIFGTPDELKAPIPENIPVKTYKLNLHPERDIPGVFWFNKRLHFSFAMQKDKDAPLMVILAGTGANHDSIIVKKLKRVFYGAGFHILALPSPTHPSFIVAGSETSVPGYVDQDVHDLEWALKAALEEVQEAITPVAINLCGYSLGAFHAAFLAERDARQKTLGFSNVIMINPPMSLYSSAMILDRMLEENIPGGLDNVHAFVEEVFEAISEVYGYTPNGGNISIRDLLYEAYKRRNPPPERLAALIGIAFRISSADMAFTADVMSQSNYVVPRDDLPGITDSLTEFYRVLFKLGFNEYAKGLYLPYYQKQFPDISIQNLIEDQSLERLAPFLEKASYIYLFHNADDIIMSPGEINYLKNTFGDRAIIYPKGGHCGNIDFHQNVTDMLEVLK